MSGHARRVILDTGPLVAVLDEDDQHHSWVTRQLQGLTPPLFVCDAVISEAIFVSADRKLAAKKIGLFLETGWLCMKYDSQKWNRRALHRVQTYHNVPMSFADACVACMVEAFGDSAVFTTDSDFQIYRPQNQRIIPLIAPFV